MIEHDKISKYLLSLTVHEKIVWRVCTWKDNYEASDQCEINLPATETIFCETCSTDGCNSAIQLEAYTVMTVISVLIKFLH